MEEALRYKLFAVRPQRKWLSRPRNFLTLPRPTPEKDAAAPPQKLLQGKDRGKRSCIIKSFWESKTFEQYF